MEHQTLGRKVIRPSNPLTQRIKLRLSDFTSLLQKGIEIKYHIYAYAYYEPRIGKQTMQSHSARTLLLRSYQFRFDMLDKLAYKIDSS